jgi:hypothetical protein
VAALSDWPRQWLAAEDGDGPVAAQRGGRGLSERERVSETGLKPVTVKLKSFGEYPRSSTG